MISFTLGKIEKSLETQVPATGLGLFRIAFGLVGLQEIVFLFYFRHLIFDTTPYLEPASLLPSLGLIIWGISIICLTLGLFTRLAAIANYSFWLGFVVTTPMLRDFDGGFDQLMTSSSFLLCFLPSERSISLDGYRSMRHCARTRHESGNIPTVSILCYQIPIFVSLALLYLDSGIHKLSTEFWQNGLGPWLPASMPYYVSAFDVSYWLNIKPLQQILGYTIIGFQFSFPFLCFHRFFRLPLLTIGCAFHLGITLVLNIYPFGLAMLVHYLLLVPFSCWRGLAKRKQLNLSVQQSDLPDSTHSSNCFVQNWNRRVAKFIWAGSTRSKARSILLFLGLIAILQVNSTIRYGVLHRLDYPGSPIYRNISDFFLLGSHIFFGISPHALYLKDHFDEYNHIFAITYIDDQGQEQWLPFVNREGRLLAPNWGRVQSMWANVAVTGHIKRQHLEAGLRKVTAFWGTKMGIDLENAEFDLLMKTIEVPVEWENNLRQHNFQQPWQKIGKLIWKKGKFNLDVGNLNIEHL